MGVDIWWQATPVMYECCLPLLTVPESTRACGGELAK